VIEGIEGKGLGKIRDQLKKTIMLLLRWKRHSRWDSTFKEEEYRGSKMKRKVMRRNLLGKLPRYRIILKRI